jgi:hypothetical protein
MKAGFKDVFCIIRGFFFCIAQLKILTGYVKKPVQLSF